MWVPLLLYLAMTIVVPILNGAPINQSFAKHSLIVLAVSAFATAAYETMKYIRRHRPTRRY